MERKGKLTYSSAYWQGIEFDDTVTVQSSAQQPQGTTHLKYKDNCKEQKQKNKLPFNILEDRDSYIPEHYSQLKPRLRKVVKGEG